MSYKAIWLVCHPFVCLYYMEGAFFHIPWLLKFVGNLS
jgi:hypothetical protein